MTDHECSRDRATLETVLRAANRAIPVREGRLAWASWGDARTPSRVHVVHASGQGA